MKAPIYDLPFGKSTIPHYFPVATTTQALHPSKPPLSIVTFAEGLYQGLSRFGMWRDRQFQKNHGWCFRNPKANHQPWMFWKPCRKKMGDFQLPTHLNAVFSGAIFFWLPSSEVFQLHEVVNKNFSFSQGPDRPTKG